MPTGGAALGNLSAAVEAEVITVVVDLAAENLDGDDEMYYHCC